MLHVLVAEGPSGAGTELCCFHHPRKFLPAGEQCTAESEAQSYSAEMETLGAEPHLNFSS